MVFERLVNSDGDDIVPSEEDLAFFAEANGWHGFDHAFHAHIAYWTKQTKLAVERVEPAREDLGRFILKWLNLGAEGLNYNDIARHPYATAEDKEGWRRTILGGLAISMLFRVGLPKIIEGPIIDGRGVGDSPVDFIVDMAIEGTQREWPYEPRIHVIGDMPLSLSEGDIWFKRDRLLACFRHPADITPVTEVNLAKKGRQIDINNVVTVLPHLVAINSPLFSK